MTCFKTKRVVAGFILSILCLVSAPALAKKKSVTPEPSKEVCQCTCSRDGAITRAWTADPTQAPERSLAQVQAATPAQASVTSLKVAKKTDTSTTATIASSSATTGDTTAQTGTSQPAVVTPSVPPATPATEVAPAAAKTTGETTTVDFSTLQKKSVESQTQVKAESKTTQPAGTSTTQAKEKAKATPAKSTSKTKVKTETPPAPAQPAIVPPQVGDTERDIRKRLGNPAIETTTDNNERLWIYTAPQLVNGVSCQVIQLKLVFKGMRLKDWIEPAQPQYIGNCPTK